jgi:hypothetical protein
VKEHMTK